VQSFEHYRVVTYDYTHDFTQAQVSSRASHSPIEWRPIYDKLEEASGSKTALQAIVVPLAAAPILMSWLSLSEQRI